jgi:hypothetical protein
MIASPPRRHREPSGAIAPRTPGTRSNRAAAALASDAGASTSIGDSEPVPIPARSSATTPARASPWLAIASAAGLPNWIVVAAASSPASTPIPASAASARWRTTIRPQASQPRLARSSRRIRGQSSRGPTVARITGNSVTATATEITGISIPATPTDRKNETGNTTSANSPIATVKPLNVTARPAVAIARTTASPPSAPFARSSRQRTMINSE